jgi:hypothetical protein
VIFSVPFVGCFIVFTFRFRFHGERGFVLEFLGMGLVNFGARTKLFSLMLNNIIKRLQDVCGVGFEGRCLYS